MRHRKSWGERLVVTMVVILLAIPSWAQTGPEEELAVFNKRVGQLYQQGRYLEATEVAKNVLKKSEHLLGNNHPHVAQALNNLAVLYQTQGQYAVAEPFYRRALRIDEAAFGAHHPSVAIDLNNLAELYRTQGQHTAAEPLYQRALQIQEAALGPDHPSVATTLNNLAALYHAQGQYAAAEPLYQRALQIREAALGLDHPDVGQSLNNLAELYRTQGQHTAAEPLYQRALQIQEAALGPDHPSVATTLNNLAALYHAQGQYAAAEPLYRRALEIWEAALGPNHPTVAAALNNLAELYRTQGQHAAAEPLYQRALQIQEAALGPDHPSVATTLNNLAALYHAQGQYAAAEPLNQRALQIQETALGPNHPTVAAGLNNLALLYYEQGQYAAAEPLYQRALWINETALGTHHPQVALNLNNLAKLYEAQGQYAAAEPLYQRALQIQEAALGPDHPDVGQSLNNLAALYHAQGQYAAAEPLYRRALEIWEAALGPNHPTVAAALNNLAELYRTQGQHAAAEPLYQRALQIQEAALGPDHPSVATTLNNLALLYDAQGQYAAAESLYQRALQIREAALGLDHPAVGQSLNNLAAVYGALTRPTEALALFYRGLAIQTRFLQDVFSRSGEAHQFQFSRTNQLAYYAALSLFTSFLNQDSKALAIGINMALARKGLVHETQARTHAILLQSLPIHLQASYQQWQDAKALRGKLLMDRPATLPLAAYRERLGQLQEEIKQLESDLMAKNPLVADTIKSQRATLKQVVPTLKPRTVLIEMVRFDEWDWKRDQWAETARYLAFVVHDTGAIHLVDLGPAKELEGVVRDALVIFRQRDWRSNLEAQEQAAYRLYTSLWEPLIKAIGDATTVVLSPDGLLNLVPFAGLRTLEGKYLIEDYTVLTVTSGRDLVKEGGVLLSSTDLFLAADPAFAWVPPSLQAQSSERAPGESEVITTTKGYSRLEGTADGLTFIPPLISGEQKVMVNREAATEQAVVDAVRPRVLHLATHGFFLEDQPDLKIDGPLFSEQEPVRILPGYENPLVRSGLALAGANHASRTTESQDGLLTAFEVTAMDLHSTDLVVLSACDTGTGVVRTGEGVYGLRRAFALAGAKNLVMSLWPVWDKQATKQMKSFYTYYGQGLPPAQALRKAQLERIAWMRKYLGAAPPSLWAPFMVQVSGPPPAMP